MPLVKSGRVVADRYVRVEDGAPVPDNVPVIVPATRFLADADEFTRREAPTGVAWPNNRPVSELAPHLDRVALVALSFPSFRDGRAYSQARILRERYGFAGELRATGQILRDQFLFLIRAGFTALEVSKDADAAAFAEAVNRYTVFYQPTADGRITALRARLAAFGAGRETVDRHPEVAAKRPSKDERPLLGPSPFEARYARTSG